MEIEDPKNLCVRTQNNCGGDILWMDESLIGDSKVLDLWTSVNFWLVTITLIEGWFLSHFDTLQCRIIHNKWGTPKILSLLYQFTSIKSYFILFFLLNQHLMFWGYKICLIFCQNQLDHVLTYFQLLKGQRMFIWH